MHHHSTDHRKLVAEGALLLDVRSPAEFAEGHVPNARNLPVQQIPLRVAELGAPGQKVVVYCKSGGRSATAAALLRSYGFDCCDVGPMAAW